LGLVRAGGYAGVILEAGPAVAGRQALRFRLGETVLRVMQEADRDLGPGPARLGIPPSAVQIWPLMAEGDAG
jgi:hypothetical protein